MKTEIDETVSLALASGAVSDCTLPIQDQEPLQPTSAETFEPWTPWTPPLRDPYTDPSVLNLADNPHGLIIAGKLHGEGHFNDGQLEAVTELWGTPQNHISRAADPGDALKLAAFYREQAVIDDNQFRAACEWLAHREVERERQEAAQLEEQTRQEHERFDREQQAENQRAEIQQRATDLFYDKIDRLEAARVEREP